jgi:hypothetical protein
MKKRLLLLVAAVSGLAWAAPAPAGAAPGCARAARMEVGASDVVDGLAVYEDGAIEPTTVALDPRVTVTVDLAAASCADIEYHAVVYDDAALTDVLAEAHVRGDGTSTTLTLLDRASIDAPSTGAVHVVVWTSSSARDVIDRAPNEGANTDTDDTGGGQSWH